MDGSGRVDSFSCVKPPIKACWRVVYLFAGAEREADLGDALLNAITALNANTRSAISLDMSNLDILRGGDSHDLLSAARQAEILEEIKSGRYDLVLAAPPCSTFSRALFSDLSFPFPLRDFKHPRGFPHLAGSDLVNIQETNTLIDFKIEALRAASAAGALGWLEFPEDLGECRHGVPSSIWSWEKVLDLASLGYLRGAIYQCEWAPMDYRKPTGLLCNFSCLMRDPHISPGWPKFSSHEPDGKGKKYCGPLPNACMHGKHSYRLIGKGDDRCFKTSKTAALPS